MSRTKGARNADYEARRVELLARMSARFMRRDLERPSLRQLAAAAEVTVPTLRHYFGSRAEVVAALLEDFRRRGAARLQVAAQPAGGFPESVEEFTSSFLRGLRSGHARLGDMFAVSLAEGLLDPEVSPLSLQHIIDPTIDSLEARLRRHQAKGEMRAADPRAAALVLISPLLMAVLHQDQMGGSQSYPLDLESYGREVAAAFVRAYRVEGAATTGRGGA